jgi:hypothetical protein
MMTFDLEKHPLRGVDSLRYRVYIEDEEEQDMEFKGYDYGELIDAFGLSDEYNGILDKIRMVEDIIDEIPCTDEEDLDSTMISSHVWEHVDDLEGTLAPTVKMQLLEFLRALRDEEHVSNGTFLAADMLLELAKDNEDDTEFVAWFCLMLPRLWT